MNGIPTVFRVLLILFATFPTAAMAANDVWADWEHELRRQCPAHHVDWICDSCYDELIGDFSATLPVASRRKADRIANYSHRCAQEWIGFSCEMTVFLDAFQRLGLLKRFTAFGCKTYRCEEVAMCTSTLPQANR